MLPSALINLINKRRRIRAISTVLPLATIPDTVNLVVHPNSTALVDALGFASLDALLQETGGHFAVVGADASVEFVKVHAVFQSTVLNQVLGGNVRVVAEHAHGEAEVDLGVWVDV